MENSSLVVATPEPIARPGGLIAASSLDDVYRFAERLAKSKLIPNNYQQKPDDTFAAIVLGLEVGLQPLAALQSVAVINGHPGLYGDGFLAVIMAAPAYLKHEECYVLESGEERDHLTPEDLERTGTLARSRFWRKGIPKPFTGTFSIADAKKANLWTKEGPWRNYPQRQLMWRARGYAGRNGFAPELRGFRIATELLDLPDDITVTADEAPRVIEMPKRRSEKNPASEEPAAPTPADSPSPDAGFLTSELPPEQLPLEQGTRPAARRGRAAPSPSPAPGQTFEGFKIVSTNYVQEGDRSYTKIEARSADKPLAYTFITDDKDLGEMAASVEGSDEKYNLTWRPGDNTRAPKILTAIVKA